MNTEPNSPRDANTRERLQAIGRMVDEELPQGWGFALFAFPFDGELGRLNYVAKGNREDVAAMIKGWLEHQEKNFGKHE